MNKLNLIKFIFVEIFRLYIDFFNIIHDFDSGD